MPPVRIIGPRGPRPLSPGGGGSNPAQEILRFMDRWEIDPQRSDRADIADFLSRLYSLTEQLAR